MNYIIITPFYNEEKYLEQFITSIISQSITPLKLLLVDDNSTDNSRNIVMSFVEKHPWIEYLYHPSSNQKIQGSKVAKAFNYGYSKINLSGVDIISKIDADLELPTNYFEEIINAFERDPSLGICGGLICEQENGIWVEKKSSDYHIRGALKSYHSKCLFQIGGLDNVLGWDGLDEMKAFYHKWKTKNLYSLKVKHFRPAASDYKPMSLYFKYGVSNYKNGGSFILSVIRSVVRLANKPYLVCGIAYFSGYFYSFVTRKKKYVDKQLAKFINSFHLKRLLKIKRYEM